MLQKGRPSDSYACHPVRHTLCWYRPNFKRVSPSNTVGVTYPVDALPLWRKLLDLCHRTLNFVDHSKTIQFLPRCARRPSHLSAKLSLVDIGKNPRRLRRREIHPAMGV